MSNSKSKNIKTAVIYARTSLEKRAGSKAIKNQLCELQKFAKEHDYTITREYIDIGQSVNNSKRTALDQLLTDAKKKAWGVVLICDQSILSRNYILYQAIESVLRNDGIEIIYAKNKPISSKILVDFKILLESLSKKS